MNLDRNTSRKTLTSHPQAPIFAGAPSGVMALASTTWRAATFSAMARRAARVGCAALSAVSLGVMLPQSVGAASSHTPPTKAMQRGTLARAGVQAQDPSAPGPYTVITQEFTKGQSGVPTNLDIYLPNSAQTFPGIVFGHGFSQYKDYQHDNAMQLASWGFVVVVPTFSSKSDHEANAYEMLDLVDWMISTQNPFSASVDTSRLGLAGHSAGGLSTTIATGIDSETDRRISASMGLDPVDVVQGSTSQGIPFAKNIVSPLFYLVGISYMCNSDGNSQGMYNAVPPTTDKMYLRIPTSVHCDFNTQGLDDACNPNENPARPLKVIRLLATQGWDAAYEEATAGTCAVDGMQVDRSKEVNLIEEYMTAYFLSELAGQTWALPWLYGGTEVARDVSAGLVTDLQY